ncbi:MAG: glycosyltransferase [Pirellulales bacterium]
MRFLIIVHEFTPAKSPRAYRWGAIAEQLVHKGHQVDVVCGWKPDLAREEPGLVHVVRVGSRLTATLRQKFARSSGGNRQRAAPIERQPSARREPLLAKVASWAYYHLWKPLYWPDAQCSFVLPALRAARQLLRVHRYDALITVSLPFSCHLIGLALKRRDPRPRWIVDIGDPFALLHDIPLNNHRLYGRLNHRVETAVLRGADHIAMTTRGALEHYRREFDFNAEKVSIIPPLQSLPAERVRVGESTPGAASSRIVRMVYCGRVYNDIRSPAYLLKLLRRLIEVNSHRNSPQLHFLGSLGDCHHVFEPYRDLIDKHLFLHGEVERATVAATLRNADVLINIGNSTSHQLPSKIVEYIGMGKPIVNLISHDQDCTLELLADYPAALNLRCHEDTIEENVSRTVQLIERLPIVIPCEKLTALQAPFLPETIAAAYLRLASSGQASWSCAAFDGAHAGS